MLKSAEVTRCRGVCVSHARVPTHPRLSQCPTQDIDVPTFPVPATAPREWPSTHFCSTDSIVCALSEVPLPTPGLPRLPVEEYLCCSEVQSRAMAYLLVALSHCQEAVLQCICGTLIIQFPNVSSCLICMCVPGWYGYMYMHMCPCGRPFAHRDQKGCWISWSWSYRWL